MAEFLNPVQLYLDVDEGVFVTSPTNVGPVVLPTFIQNDKRPIELTLLKRDPSGGIEQPYTVIKSPLSLKVGVVKPASTLAASAIYAFGTLSQIKDLSPITSSGSYGGVLDLGTANIETLLGASTQASAVFEVEAVGVGERVSAQSGVTVKADAFKDGSTPPNPGSGSHYYSATEIEDLFLAANRTDQIVSATIWHIESDASIKITAETPGTHAWSFSNTLNDETVARRGDVVLKTGGNFDGALSVQGHGVVTTSGSYAVEGPLKILRTPVDDNDVAPKSYVDAHAATQKLGPGLKYSNGTLHPDFFHTSAASIASGTHVASANHIHVTNQIAEGTNLFHTSARVRATTLEGFATSVGVVSASDTVLSAIGKLEATKVSTAGGTISTLTLGDGSAAGPSLTHVASQSGLFFPQANQLAVTLGGSEAVRVINGGLQIGSTSFLALLGVKGNADQVLQVLRGHTTHTTDFLQVQNNAGDLLCRVNRYGGIEISSDGVPAASIKGVKIASSSAGGNATVQLQNNTLGNGAYVELKGSGDTASNSLALINTLPTGSLLFATNNTERARFTSAGLLGINTTAPAAFVHIALTSTTMGLLIKQGASSTGDLLSAQTSDGTARFKVNATGNVSIAQPNVTDAPIAALNITTTWISQENHLGIKLNATDGNASADSASLIDLQKDSVVMFKGYKLGVLYTNPTFKRTAAENGDIWSDSEQKARHIYEAGVEQALVGVIFTGTADATCSNTDAATSIAPTGIGTKTIPSNAVDTVFFTIGKTLRVRARGLLSTKAATPGNIAITLKLGIYTLATATISPVGGLSSTMWELECDTVARTTGATGTVTVTGKFQHLNAGAWASSAMQNTFPTTTIDMTGLTSALGLDLTADWVTADADNSITTRTFSIEVLN